MTVLVLRAMDPPLRGELSRWMVEFQAGVFVGNVPASVRERLWQKVTEYEDEDGSAILLYPARTEQGFAVRCHGEPTRQPVDFDGVVLMRFLGEKKRNSALSEEE